LAQASLDRPVSAHPPVSVPSAELDRLFALRHSQPHSILGIHPTPSGAVLRAWRVDARSITVISESGERILMTRGQGGLFEALCPAESGWFRYALLVEGEDRRSFFVEDPYRFEPTITELDLRLFADGRHERIQEYLGAHPREIDGVEGVSFAVWAPNAEGVSVVGDFNRWDGRLQPMRKLDPGGVWEIFIPGVREGALYKYEMHGANGRLFVKTDPYAFSMERPPDTASRVFAPAYRFRDDEWMEARAAQSPWTRPMSIYEVHLSSWCRVAEEG